MSVNGKTISISTSHGDIAVFKTDGGGTPIVFLHGNSVSKEAFAPQLDAFAGTRRMIAIDLPGHGDSSDAVDPGRSYSTAGYADCVVETLAAMDVERAVVVGWSLGGHVGLELTARFPGLAGLVAIGAPPVERRDDGTLAGFRPHPRLFLTGQEAFTDGEAEEFACLIADFDDLDEMRRDPTWARAVRRSHGVARVLMVERLYGDAPRRQRDLAEACPVPLALIVGADDLFVDVDYVMAFSCPSLWTGEAIVIAGQRHAPHLHAAAEVNRILADFIAEVAPV